jgi:hypothetical protein
MKLLVSAAAPRSGGGAVSYLDVHQRRTVELTDATGSASAPLFGGGHGVAAAPTPGAKT